jgi:serine phosphatase RsbU (regulator of sigma subunit)
VEVPVEPSLPLGLAYGIKYTETTLQLAPSDRITLMTDGVLEARDRLTGELFGFKRTAEVSGQSAESIAQAAQKFGQEDDITVLTLTLMPVEVAHA